LRGFRFKRMIGRTTHRRQTAPMQQQTVVRSNYFALSLASFRILFSNFNNE
jgi:hypothetical protein